MEIAAGVVLLIVAMLVAAYDRFAAQRAYAARYAARHGGIPQLVDWFFTPDQDAEVERLRRIHRNLTVVTIVLPVVAIVLLLSRGVTVRP